MKAESRVWGLGFGVWGLLGVCLLGLVCGSACAADDAAWPLACRLSSYGKYEAAAWTHLPSLGVHYVFMAVPKPEDVDGIMQRLKENKLTALVIRGNTELSKPDSVQELAGQLAVCEKMGVKYMFLSPKHADVSKEVAIERLRQAGDIAKQHGVTIVLETHPDLGTNGAVQAESMKTINHPNIRVNFDTANITFYNKNTDAATELKKSIDYVATIELKDHSGEFESWTFPPLGQGKVDFPALFAVLKEHKFQGPMTIEFEGTKGVELSEEQTKQAIANCVKHLRTLANFK